MSSFISKVPLGTLSGGAQDDVELVLARDIRKLEVEMGQPKHTLNIPKLVATLNERHAFVPPEKAGDLATNVEHAYDYAVEQTPLRISRAGYDSYVADETVKAVRDSVKSLGEAVKGILPKPGKA